MFKIFFRFKEFVKELNIVLRKFEYFELLKNFYSISQKLLKILEDCEYFYYSPANATGVTQVMKRKTAMHNFIFESLTREKYQKKSIRAQ